MTNTQETAEAGAPNTGSAAFAAFEPWSDWLRNNMGAMMPDPARDPLMSVMKRLLREANPVNEVIPIDWMEITRALQTLWTRQLADPQNTIQTDVK